MAQTSRPQSPWPPGQTPDPFMPPAKRQRLSPNPGSPYSTAASTPYAQSPSFANIALPNGAFSSSRPNGASPLDSIARVNPGVMGPPQRPAERLADKPKEDKPLDINELNDLITSSGVNLKDEEDFLNASFRGSRNSANSSSASQSQNTLQTSFDLLGQNRFGALGAARSSFQQSQPTQSEEEELYEKHKNAARILAEHNQVPLNDPFLWGASLRKRMQSLASDNGLQIPITGLWDRISEKPQSMSGTLMKDNDGHGIQVTKAPSMLNSGSPLEPMLSLLSCAGNERIRSLLEDAYGLARGRQLGSDGVVPPDWADIATGDGPESVKVQPKSVTGTAWDAVDVSNSDDLNDGKNSHETGRSGQAVTTTSFTQSRLNAALMTLSQRDRAAEEARLLRREARRKKKKTQQAALPLTLGSPIDPSTPVSATKALPPGMLGEKAPEVKMTKKEREKAAKQDISEEVAAREANATASMQIGGKQYSWMKSAAPKSNPQLPKSTTAKSGASAGSVAPQPKDPLDGVRDRKFGGWREDGVGGKGIQLRDWIQVLELDGREKATLLHAYLKLDAGLNRPDGQQPQQQQHTTT